MAKTLLHEFSKTGSKKEMWQAKRSKEKIIEFTDAKKKYSVILFIKSSRDREST